MPSSPRRARCTPSRTARLVQSVPHGTHPRQKASECLPAGHALHLRHSRGCPGRFRVPLGTLVTHAPGNSTSKRAPRLPVVAIVGASTPSSPDAVALARDLGGALKRAGMHLVCGGRVGIMEAVCQGFASVEGPGMSIGILMASDGADANDWLDVVLPTGLGFARNALVAQAGDVVLGVDSGAGTLSELALAWWPAVGPAPRGRLASEDRRCTPRRQTPRPCRGA